MPTLFLAIVVVSVTLSAALAWVAYGRDRKLLLWAGALALHALAYGLLSLNGQIHDGARIVLAHVALSASLAVFAQGVYQFQTRAAPLGLIWAPVAVIAMALALLRADLASRGLVSGLLFALQCGLILRPVLQRHHETVGRGQYLLATGALVATLVFAYHAIATATGQVPMLSFVASSTLQSATFLTTIFSLILLALGLVVMTKDRAKDAAQRSELFVQGVLDSMPNQIAVIDEQGIVLSVNQAWQQFAIDNSRQPGQPAPRTGVGTSYLGICQAAPSATVDGAHQAAQGLRDVLSRRLPSFSLEYPCHAPHRQRWFTMTITPLGGGHQGAVVVHTDITTRKLAEEQIRNLAYYDPLTRLPNRRMLQERLTLALANSRRSGLHGALMLLDLDNFKPLNDQHGHLAGDLLLVEVAHRLGAHVREIDTVARQGGDEFVVLLAALHADVDTSRAQALAVAEKLREALAQPYALASDPAARPIEHRCTASIGVALFDGQDTQPNDIVKRADEAMYQAKNAGRNTVHLHP